MSEIFRRVTRSMDNKSFYEQQEEYKITKKIKKTQIQSEQVSYVNIIQKNQYIEKMKLALKEAISRNQELQNKIMRLESLIAAAQDDIEQKDLCIIELYQIIQNYQLTQKTEI